MLELDVIELVDHGLDARWEQRLGVQPTEMLFLDDVEGHVRAAHACGIHASLFQETTQAIAALEAVLQAQPSSEERAEAKN